MEYVLLEDAVSVFHVIYDRKGAKVTIVTMHGDVAIVENKKGNKYPVSQSNLLPVIGKS